MLRYCDITGLILPTNIRYVIICRDSFVDKSVFVQLPTSADNVALPAFAAVPCGAAAADRRPCRSRSISPARRAHSSKPAAVAGDGRTDRRKHDSCIDPARHTMRAETTSDKKRLN